ncbi:MAG TPA: phosphoribosylformylglycinamidine synthase [Acidobacteriota bacterium]|nr:phosphoribosylformylglycinamidine synthase [Acidobacteriota bacterium]
MAIQRLYRLAGEDQEYCFYVEISEPLAANELTILRWLLAETFEPERLCDRTFLEVQDGNVIEVGPRLNFETAFSTNAVGICRACGLGKVSRIEKSRRWILPGRESRDRFIAAHHDRMTECPYPSPLESFETGIVPEPVETVPLIEKGVEALHAINRELGLGMDAWDLDFYYDLFVNKFRRDPTNVECFQLAQANSEHSRHWFFKGKMIIDGEAQAETLLDIIKSTLRANPSNSIIAFKDNSSGIRGYEVDTIVPKLPGKCSPFVPRKGGYDLIFTAETHNFPSGVAPFPGAETGTGGRIRDVHATGRGALVIAGTAGYCVGNLNMEGFAIPGEERSFSYPSNLANPIQILIGESNGASDYGNCFGEPVIQGFARSFGLALPDGTRREWIKPIMFTGGVGQLDSRDIEKGRPQKGMLVIQIGGPAYRIGIGGGAASSMIQGENKEELDFSAVQRGDAEMEQKMNRVIRTCVEMGGENPIVSVHDQGAGGPCNVLTELVDPAGGRIEIRNITLGDKTMSVLEIWGAEYQERTALLLNPGRLEQFQAVCAREKVTCEVLGEVTGDGRIVVHDAQDDSAPVDLELAPILTSIPQKSFELHRVQPRHEPLRLPEDLTVAEALRLVFRLPSVGSKGYLVRKVDRSVTGLVARQQCCGPLHLPVSDFAVVAQSHFSTTGAAISVGEQPVKSLVDVRAGVRMAVAEALTNIVWARISALSHIKCSVNWMWAAKTTGEGAALYDGALALRDLMITLGIAADGGKDSLSMAARVGETVVKAPGQVVISAYATMPDIMQAVTPDIKRPGESRLMLVDPAPGKNRLGGSALAQAFGQVGDECPDVDDPQLLKQAFNTLQELIAENLVLAGHDCSDGGLATTLAEMAMSGNCGLEITLDDVKEIIPQLFSEELGLVIEYLPESEERITSLLQSRAIPFRILGETQVRRQFVVRRGTKTVLDIATHVLLTWWEAVSDEIEKLQMSPVRAREQAGLHDRQGPRYHLTFEPHPTSSALLQKADKPKVAILREEGSNGDREMTSAFYAAGFQPWDLTMTDLLNGEATLGEFRGLVFVGGFSYADVLDSAKGWGGIIRFNARLREMFDTFYGRPDTFTLGVCNGCQLMALLGWVPWKGIPDTKQPRFIKNISGRFESRWPTVKIVASPAMMLQGMEGSAFGIWVAHGEGRLYCPDPEILDEVRERKVASAYFVDDDGNPTDKYPFNPNGSSLGIAALCSPDGRHLAIMPHPERAFLKWQWPWMPESWRSSLRVSPWLRMFQNARTWCDNRG